MQKVRTPPRASGPRIKARRLPLSYVLFWSFAGAASAAYLGIVISDPHLVSALPGPAQPGSPLENTSDELFASPQVNTLRDRLSNAQTEIAKLRSELDEHKQTYAEEQAEPMQASEQQPSLASNDSSPATGYDSAANVHEELADTDVAQPSRFAAYESEPAAVVGVPGISVPGISLFEPPANPASEPEPPAPVSEVAIANAAMESEPSEPSSIETGAIRVPPAPEPGLRPKPVPVAVVREPGSAVGVTATPGKSPIKVAPVKVATTSSAASATPPAQNVALAPAAVSRPAAEAKPAIGVRLATGQSLEALRVTWKAMRDRHPEILKGLAPRYVEQDALGSAPFSLVAGPVSKPTDVLEICADLGGEARECALATFTGKKL